MVKLPERQAEGPSAGEFATTPVARNLRGSLLVNLLNGPFSGEFSL